MTNEQYTYLLWSMDLNILYSDLLQDYFSFTSVWIVRVNQDVQLQKDYEKIECAIKSPSVAMVLIFYDSYLTEIVCQEVSFTMTKFTSEKNHQEIAASQIFIMNEVAESE